jgi:uncharacterized protein (UPF0332 family)
VLDPVGLLRVADHLLEHGKQPQSDPAYAQACLRRSVSTAYYAVFHDLVSAGAQRFMGREHQDRPGAVILYRGFTHARMKQVCEDLRSGTLKAKYRKALGQSAVSQSMRDFATAFKELQDHRHDADYDPSLSYETVDVESILSTARSAIAAFGRADAAERADVLALLLVDARG